MSECPKCGAPHEFGEAMMVSFRCGSQGVLASDCDSFKTFYESEQCLHNQRDQLIAERDRLKEAFEAITKGDVRLAWNPDGYFATRDGDCKGPYETPLEAVLAALLKEKREGR